MVLLILAIAAYMLLLSLLAIVTPGLGLSGSLLTVVPDAWRDFAHAPAYGLLAYLVIWGLHRSGWSLPSSLLTGLSVPLLFGLYTELLQHQVPGRAASAQDVLADLLGAVIAGSIVLFQTAALRAWRLAPQPRLLPRGRRRGMRGPLWKGRRTR